MGSRSTKYRRPPYETRMEQAELSIRLKVASILAAKETFCPRCHNLIEEGDRIGKIEKPEVLKMFTWQCIPCTGKAVMEALVAEDAFVEEEDA